MESVFLLLAYLALGSIPSLEQLRYQAPGEWGKLLGLDRIPEVKTLREKTGLLGDDETRTARWSSQLARDWMAHDVQAAGVLLIDGHTRVYHGSLTKLPRRYVSRERLCLRGTTDYWVNALDGQPFFCVTQPIDPGLIKTLEADIIPRLLEDIPNQPTAEALEADPRLQQQQAALDVLKTQRKATPHHIQLKDLPPDQRIHQLRAGRKHFIDTIKLIAYRSETALVHLARETLRRVDDARSFVRGLMQTPINLRPDLAAGELRIELHGQANPAHDAVVTHLCEELNATETHYPSTNLRLKYIPLRSPTFLPGQDV